MPAVSTDSPVDTSIIRAVAVPIAWHSDLPVYAAENFLREVGDTYGWLAGIDQNGERRCILPYTIVRKGPFRFVRFRVETIALDESFHEAEERLFLSQAMEHFRTLGAHVVLPATNNAIFRTYPPGANAAPYGTYLNSLSMPEEELFAQLSPAFRKSIRCAIKARVQIETGLEYLDEAYDLVAGTLKRSRMRFKSRESFKREILSGLGENVVIAVAKLSGKVHACLIAPFSRYSGFSWYGGTVAEPATGAMHLLHWEVLRRLSAAGVARFNFSGVRIHPEPGSKQEGIATFKMRFGGKLVAGYMWKYPLDRLRFAAYSAAARVLQGGDIVDREGYKLQHA